MKHANSLGNLAMNKWILYRELSVGHTELLWHDVQLHSLFFISMLR